MSFSGQTQADLRAQMQDDASKRVRNNLVLEAVGKAENIEVSDEEVNQELEKMAESYKRPAEEIRGILEGNGSLDSLRDEVKLRKTIEVLVENSKVVEPVEAPAEEAAAEADEK